MKKLKIALAIALVFIAGFGAGVVVTRAAVRHWVRQFAARPGRVRELVEKRLTARLRLDREQQQKTARILDRTQSDIRVLRDEFAPRFQGIISNAEGEVSALLTPDQQARFKKLHEENRRLWQPK